MSRRATRKTIFRRARSRVLASGLASCLCWALAAGVATAVPDETSSPLPEEATPTAALIVAPDTKLVRLAEGLKFTEGPVWLPREGKLVFSDIPNSKLMQWSEAEGLSLFRESRNPNGNILDQNGSLLTCRHGARDIVRTESDGTLRTLVKLHEGKRLNSPNDLTVQRDGVIWFTDPPWGLSRGVEGKEQDGHFVYRFDPSTGNVQAVLRDLVMPNGIALAPDESHLYVADTGGHRSHPDPTFRDRPATVSAYALTKERQLATTEPVWQVEARCDGMCVDERGNIYTTGGGGVTVLAPDGSTICKIPVPETPANACFGGADGRTLFITARTSLYAIRLEIAGHLP